MNNGTIPTEPIEGSVIWIVAHTIAYFPAIEESIYIQEINMIPTQTQTLLSKMKRRIYSICIPNLPLDLMTLIIRCFSYSHV